MLVIQQKFINIGDAFVAWICDRGPAESRLLYRNLDRH
jgi:hypothetical protein